MDLYDDIDTKPRTSQIDGWSSGIKMLQTQLAIKKAQQLPKAKELPKKPLMTPVVNLRTKRPANEEHSATAKSETAATPQPPTPKPIIKAKPLAPVLDNIKTDDWDFVDEYDPQWPNEYEKLKEKDKKEKNREARNERNERTERGGERMDARNERNDRKRGRNGRNANVDSPPVKFSGFGQRQTEEERYSPPAPGSLTSKGGGAAIAPPPCIQEIALDAGDGSASVTIPYSASSVAAKIMAKYGFRDGQGLGKSEQGMSMALQVEKTSKRGGRIIHEKDVILPPPPPPSPSASSSAASTSSSASTAPSQAQAMDNFAMPTMLPPPAAPAPAPPVNDPAAPEPSITEIMKAPSKVVLLRNMVGPGDVDDELEPEVKDECNTKYGDVVRVLIHESLNVPPEDAVKIFVEFKRIESAIKAVVDLNGRFFGGRQVRAGFYNFDKFQNYQLS